MFLYLIGKLASGYGWSKEQTLDCYLDEAMELCNQIDIKEASDHLTNLAIVSNPHTKKPKELYSQLKRNLKSVLPKQDFSEEAKKNKEKWKRMFGKKKK